MTRQVPVWAVWVALIVGSWALVIGAGAVAFLWLPQRVAQGGLGFLAVLGALGAIGWGAK